MHPNSECIYEKDGILMAEDEEGREKIKRKEDEINEKLARDMEKRMRREEAKAEKAKDQRGGGAQQRRSPHR